LTSILAAIAEGDYTVLNTPDAIGFSMEAVNQELETLHKRSDACTSDWAYWSIESDITYWTAVKTILKGAELVGPDNMPEVRYSSKSQVLMDVMADIAEFGSEVYKKCYEISKNHKN